MKTKQMILGISMLALLAVGCSSGIKKEGSADSTVQVDNTEEVQEAKMVGKQNDLKASFTNINGETVALSDLKGKVVVMNFWATWCPPCIAEMPSLQKLHEELKSEKDIVFMAIEVDQDIDKAAKFMAKNKYTLPLYTVGSELPEELMSNSIPMTVILAKNGDIIGKQVGMMDFKSEKLKQGLIDLTKENER
ncbi:TlpA family protein disulfide reductase [Sphingobacterium mizutaii]|uniref:TlpA family protein disulfide reductase n=1 Tax=Sphingobacterium mizutaii TaxID=1010 RepID=UPI00162A1A86|nr:TlpA disulfide reductase family protein [Sphingobacterium mizutaii]